MSKEISSISSTFVAATHHGPHGVLIVIYDSDIKDKVFSEGGRQISVGGQFFAGDEKTRDEVMVLLKSARHLHLTGKRIIEMALNLELVDINNVLWVAGVPHAQVFCDG